MKIVEKILLLFLLIFASCSNEIKLDVQIWNDNTESFFEEQCSICSRFRSIFQEQIIANHLRDSLVEHDSFKYFLQRYDVVYVLEKIAPGKSTYSCYFWNDKGDVLQYLYFDGFSLKVHPIISDYNPAKVFKMNKGCFSEGDPCQNFIAGSIYTKVTLGDFNVLAVHQRGSQDKGVPPQKPSD